MSAPEAAVAPATPTARRRWHGPRSLAASTAGTLVVTVCALLAGPVWALDVVLAVVGVVLLAVPRLREVGTGLLAAATVVPAAAGVQAAWLGVVVG